MGFENQYGPVASGLYIIRIESGGNEDHEDVSCSRNTSS